MDPESLIKAQITPLEIERGDGPRLEASLVSKAKTSLRIRYEAESQMILKKFGGLSGIQVKLTLSQRKICQLLMVDPSSWSRWITDEAKTPPHILRALEWYLALNDKYPGFDVNFWLHSKAKTTNILFDQTMTLQEDMQLERLQLSKQIEDLQGQLKDLKNLVEEKSQENNQNHLKLTASRDYIKLLVASAAAIGLLLLMRFISK